MTKEKEVEMDRWEKRLKRKFLFTENQTTFGQTLEVKEIISFIKVELIRARIKTADDMLNLWASSGDATKEGCEYWHNLNRQLEGLEKLT